MQKRHWVQRIVDAAQLHGEVMPGVPLVEIAGETRVLIECIGGVTAYSPQRIRVKVRYGEVEVCGSGLEIPVMTREYLVISGSIDGVSLYRRAYK